MRAQKIDAFKETRVSCLLIGFTVQEFGRIMGILVAKSDVATKHHPSRLIDRIEEG